MLVPLPGTKIWDIVQEGKILKCTAKDWNEFIKIEDDGVMSLAIKKSGVVWLTGLPASGKTTLADNLYTYLKPREDNVERLDGDIIRGIFQRTGFTKEARDEHIKQIGFLSSILERNGVIVICSFVSPYRDARNYVRSLCRNFIEVYVKAPLEVCIQRDPKGLYKKAREGLIKNFTGIDDPYEEPVRPELVIDTQNFTVQESLRQLREYISKNIV